MWASCRAIDSFDEIEAATSFAAVASGPGVFRNGAKKVFNDRLMATKIADHCRRGALIFVPPNNSGVFVRRSAQVNGDDLVVFEDDRAFGNQDKQP